MRILITGASGFIGQELSHFFSLHNHTVIKVVHHSLEKKNEITCDLTRDPIPLELLENLDCVIHLAGKNINCRWTPENKKQILCSRVESTQRLCQALSQLNNPPKTLICASATGYYGDRPQEQLTENSMQGQGFLSDVCAEWEAAADQARAKGIRVVHTRFGVVLSPKGGMLKQLLPIFRLGLGGKIGSGEQMMSWIALDDIVKCMDFIIRHSEVEGVINVVSPNPVSNREFTQVLGTVLHRPTFLTVPEFLVKWLLGERGESLLLSSQNVRPKKLEESGFSFSYADLKAALNHLIR